MKLLLQSLIDRWHFKQHGVDALLRGFRPKVRLYLERGDYIIKTVESSWELHAALRLRHRVFYQEMFRHSLSNGMDLDDLDLICDHLVVIDKRHQTVVATYRLLASTFSDRFYSADHFFVMDDFLKRPGVKLEIGRACVHKTYRRGLMVALLWKGIHRYIRQIHARYVFGCSTILTKDPHAVARLCRYLSERGHIEKSFDIFPHEGCRLKGLWEALTALSGPAASLAEEMIPSLLQFYLKGGARVIAQPAFDHSFQWIVFLTILDTGRLPRSFQRNFDRC